MVLGNLGAHPEIRKFPNGGRVCSLRIATSESWKDRNSGEQRERTEWHSVSVFEENSISYAEKYLTKGAKVYCEGKLETRKWQDQSGNDRYSTEICVRSISGKLIGLDKSEDYLNKPTTDEAQQPPETTQLKPDNDIIPF